MADLALSDDLRQTVARGRRDLAWLLAPVDALEARALAAEAAARGAPARPLTPGVSECLSGPCHDPDDSCHDSGDAR